MGGILVAAFPFLFFFAFFSFSLFFLLPTHKERTPCQRCMVLGSRVLLTASSPSTTLHEVHLEEVHAVAVVCLVRELAVVGRRQPAGAHRGA
jgi:hypothetical protein